MATLKPFVNLGPGDSIRADMEDKGWSQKDLAEILGMSEKHLNQLLNNKVAVTIETARLLGSVFKESPEFWLNLDAAYRLRATRSETENKPEVLARLFEFMPIRDMQRKGWLPSEKVLLPAAALSYWGFTSIEEFATLEKASQRVCFRRSQKFESYNFHFALTWLHKVKTLLEQESITPTYSPQTLQGLAEEIPDYSQRKQGILLFLSALQDTGVRFLIVPHLEKTYTDGASLWFQGNPVIVLTNRFDRNDNFWFTITHEIGHILLHLDDLKKNHAYIDSIDGKDESKDDRETQADDFARKHLKIDDLLRFFELRQRVSEKAVIECARILNLHPALIVGCLQHEGRISYKLLNRHKEPIKHLLQPFLRGIEEAAPVLPRRRKS